MLHALIVAPSAISTHGLDRRTPNNRTNYCEALAALSLLADGYGTNAESEKRAISQLIGLPQWLTAMIVKRHAAAKLDFPVDITIKNILAEFEDEGVLGPAS
jgi:hypothetical protein